MKNEQNVNCWSDSMSYQFIIYIFYAIIVNMINYSILQLIFHSPFCQITQNHHSHQIQIIIMLYSTLTHKFPSNSRIHLLLQSLITTLSIPKSKLQQNQQNLRWTQKSFPLLENHESIKQHRSSLHIFAVLHYLLGSYTAQWDRLKLMRHAASIIRRSVSGSPVWCWVRQSLELSLKSMVHKNNNHHFINFYHFRPLLNTMTHSRVSRGSSVSKETPAETMKPSSSSYKYVPFDFLVLLWGASFYLSLPIS